jgi:carbohydrate kinase (thermoresistant glucokinase family)
MLRLVVMGVSGCGKTTLGAALAARLGVAFVDADDLHPPANRAKMAAGVALTDADRWPWLDLVAEALHNRAPVVVACSALRRAYRDRLRAAGGEGVRFLHLAAPREVIAARLAARRGHFAAASLLDSQYATLEPPGPGEALTLDARLPPDALLAEALARL